MTVEVLARRGNADTIAAWLDKYMPRLTEMPRSTQPIHDGTWRAALGHGKPLGDWAEYFTREVAEQPWTQVLATWWPRLLPGIAAGATQRSSGSVTPSARSRKTERALQLRPSSPTASRSGRPAPARSRNPPPRPVCSAAQAFAGLPHLRVQTGLIVDRLGRPAEAPGWSTAQAALRAPTHDDDVLALLEGLVDAATLRYLTHGHGSPVLLVHTATAPTAVLHTLPILPRELWAPSPAAVWSASAALIAAYEPTYAVPREDLPAAPTTDNPVAQAVQRSAEHGDEHVIKLTDTAVDVYERDPQPRRSRLGRARRRAHRSVEKRLMISATELQRSSVSCCSAQCRRIRTAQAIWWTYGGRPRPSR